MSLPYITIAASHDGTWVATDPLTGSTATGGDKYAALSKLHTKMIDAGASLVERRLRVIPRRPAGGAVKQLLDKIAGRAA